MLVLRGKLQVEIVETIVLEHFEHEVEQVLELVLHLLTGAVDVGIILSQTAHAGQSVNHAGLLVAVDGAELEEAQRQFSVGTLA